MLKKLFKISAWLIGITIGLFCIFLLLLTITDYKPPQVEVESVKNNGSESIKKNKMFTITTYNIGYCGLDKDQDFFMDYGKGTKSKSKAKTMTNLKSITDYLADEKSDFLFIQEADVKSTRSYKINEYDYIIKYLDAYSSAFVNNYKVFWMPFPIDKPYGKINSGLITLCKQNNSNASRLTLPGSKSWPQKLIDMDYCFIESRIPVKDGKELVLVNVQLAPYDNEGTIRKQQLEFIKKYVLKEYKNGNYVIVGGDWNQVIPGTESSKFQTAESVPDYLKKVTNNFKSTNFKWAADSDTPTQRSLDIKYEKDANFLSITDGFLVSPNVEVKKVRTRPLDFKYTYHNPVTGYFILK